MLEAVGVVVVVSEGSGHVRGRFAATFVEEAKGYNK